LWLPRCENVTRTVATETCMACSDNRFRNDDCLIEGHPCMDSVQPDQVISWLQTLMSVPAGVDARVRLDAAPSETGSDQESASSL